MRTGIELRAVPRVGGWVREPVGVLFVERRWRSFVLGISLVAVAALGVAGVADPPPGGMADRRGPIIVVLAAVTIPILAAAGLAFIRSAIRPGGVVLLPEGVFATRPFGRILVPWSAIVDVTVITASRYRGQGRRQALDRLTALVVAPGASLRTAGVLLSAHERAARSVSIDPRQLVADLDAEGLARVIHTVRATPGLHHQLAADEGRAAVESLVTEVGRGSVDGGWAARP